MTGADWKVLDQHRGELSIADIGRECAIVFWRVLAHLAYGVGSRERFIYFTWRAAMARGKRTAKAWEIFE